MQNEDQPKRGRPSAYSDKIAEAICDRLVDGESLSAICADPGMPGKATCSAGSRPRVEKPRSQNI
jgi:hypothetical protein